MITTTVDTTFPPGQRYLNRHCTIIVGINETFSTMSTWLVLIWRRSRQVLSRKLSNKCYKMDAMSQIDTLVGSTSKSRYMGVHWSKKHRKDFVVSDILDNRLIHYNMDRKRASIVRGNDNLKQPGACCLIEHPDDKRLLTCALDHCGIVIFDMGFPFFKPNCLIIFFEKLS